jgi:hypothetical protein
MFTQKLKSGATVTVTAWITFENKPVMRIQDFHKGSKLSLTKNYLVRMEVEHKDNHTLVAYQSQTTGSYCEMWMTLNQFQKLVQEFEEKGGDFIFTHDLIVV